LIRYPKMNPQTVDHFEGDETVKHDTQHVEKLENGSDHGLGAEYQTYDPKWEKQTTRKIDRRLLIIREWTRSTVWMMLTLQSVFVTLSV